MRTPLGAVVAVATAAFMYGCGNSTSPTSPTSPTAPSAAASAAGDPLPADTPFTGPEWTLTTPPGLPSSGCIALSDISGNQLTWTVDALPGHPDRILMQGTAVREERSDCSPIPGRGDTPRQLQVSGGGWTYTPSETGTRTITWSPEECSEDGGRFRIDVLIKRDVPSITDADRQAVELIVNCGPFKRS